jgi:hypothetical protein
MTRAEAKDSDHRPQRAASKDRHAAPQDLETFCNDMKPIVAIIGWIVDAGRRYSSLKQE